MEFSNCTEEIMGPKRDSFSIIIPMIIIYVLIFFTGIIGNISTCIVISRNKSMHTATNYYLFSLAISDLLLLVSGLPQEIYSMYSRYPFMFGSAFCFLRGLFAETSTNATVLTITAFTIERYLAICHPFLSHTMSKLSRAIKLILGIWLVAVWLAVPQAMQFKIVGPSECELCVFYEPIIKHSFEVSTCLFFFMPMMLITVLYVLIGVRLRSSSMVNRMVSNRQPSKMRVKGNSSRKIVKMLVAVVVAFFLCWAPFHAQRLYWKYSSAVANLDPESQHLYLKIYEVVTYISGILYYLSATINPILYNIMSVKFREAFKETFSRCCCFKSNRPKRCYSVLSRSVQRGPESTTDSGRDDAVLTHTTVTNKSSSDSFNGPQQNSKRNTKTLSTLRGLKIKEESLERTPENSATTTNHDFADTSSAKFIRININHHPTHKMNRFWRYFQCLAKRTLDDSKRLSVYYSTPIEEPNILIELKHHMSPKVSSPSDISNSSLKDIETGAIEDELTAYMREVKERERIS